MYIVSDEILSCFEGLMESIVRMLCSRSAILMSTTRTSSLMLIKSFLKFSLCMEVSMSKIP